MTAQKLININWYMHQKPYTAYSDYDLFYLDICRKLFVIIKKLSRQYAEAIELDDEDCRVLAYIVTAYFEDMATGIGFWQSLIALNKKHFNKRIPFFDNDEIKEQEAFSDDIIPADIHYLLFINYIALKSEMQEKIMVFFEKPFFYEASEKLFDFLSEIEEVPVSSFYNDYLIPDADFIEFKKKLGWFTMNGYINALQFSLLMQRHEEILLDNDTDLKWMSMLMYAERDRLLFEEPSIFTAFFPVDIFAGALHCDEAKKEEIRSLKFRPHGIFHIQNESSTHIHFLHTATGEELDVLKSSFNHPPDSSVEEYFIATVAGWDGEYYISGMCLPSPYKGEEIYTNNLQNQHAYQKHFAPYRESIFNTAKGYSDKALEYFGKQLVNFETGKKLQAGLDAYNKWYFDEVADKTKLTAEAKPARFILPEELLAAKDIALFIPPSEGFEFILKHSKLLEILQAPDPEKIKLEQIEEVIFLFLDDSVSSNYWFYLKKNYELPNLSLFLKCIVEEDKAFEAILRIYKPKDFSPLKLPRFTTFTSERVSHEKARKIFGTKE
jgi:hypothetical protein